MIKTIIVLMTLFLSGCAAVSTQNRPNDYYHPTSEVVSDEPLFGTSAGLLADKDITRILNYHLKLPAKSRIAILKLSNDNYWRNYSSSFTNLTESIAKDFVGQLRKSPRVYDASFLPSMLVPGKRTVPYLREAAARYQADLLLAYRTNCKSFRKFRFINPDETKAYCSVEVVLLDIRSGIVPFTVISSNEFSAKKDRKDNNFQETMKKAELKSIAKSLKEAALRLNEFLTNVGTF